MLHQNIIDYIEEESKKGKPMWRTKNMDIWVSWILSLFFLLSMIFYQLHARPKNKKEEIQKAL